MALANDPRSAEDRARFIVGNLEAALHAMTACAERDEADATGRLRGAHRTPASQSRRAAGLPPTLTAPCRAGVADGSMYFDLVSQLLEVVPRVRPSHLGCLVRGGGGTCGRVVVSRAPAADTEWVGSSLCSALCTRWCAGGRAHCQASLQHLCCRPPGDLPPPPQTVSRAKCTLW
jgi:hypothetical protein